MIVFKESTMVHHHQTTSWGGIVFKAFSKHLKHIQGKRSFYILESVFESSFGFNLPGGANDKHLWDLLGEHCEQKHHLFSRHRIRLLFDVVQAVSTCLSS